MSVIARCMHSAHQSENDVWKACQHGADCEIAGTPFVPTHSYAFDDIDPVEPLICEADRYNVRTESYDGICLAPLRADGTCPRAFQHA